MEKWLKGTKMRDQFGGWNPMIMNRYIRGKIKLGAPPPGLDNMLWDISVSFFASDRSPLMLVLSSLNVDARNNGTNPAGMGPPAKAGLATFRCLAFA